MAELKRSVSLPLLVFYGTGTMIGAGIYVLTGAVAGAAGVFAPISFLVAAVLAGFTAFTYAELSARIPRSAGEALFVSEGFKNEKLGSLVGYVIIFTGIVSAGTLAHGFAGYFRVFVDWPPLAIACGFIVLLTLIAIAGIKESVYLAATITVFSLIGIALIIVLTLSNLSSTEVEAVMAGISVDGLLSFGVLTGALLAFYSFIGFEDMVNIAEEVKHPERTLPLGILLSMLITTILYVALAILSVLAMPIAELAASEAPFADLLSRYGKNYAMIIGIISLVSVINTAIAQIIMASRVLYGLGRQAYVPAVFSRVSERSQTPVHASIAVSILVILAVLFFPLKALAKTTSVALLLVFGLVNVSLILIKKRSEEKPAFSVPAFVPWMGGILICGFLIAQLASKISGH